MPPLLRLLALNWRRFGVARRTLDSLADGRSRSLFLRHALSHFSLRDARPAGGATELVPLCVRELGGGKVWCRSCLPDFGVLYDTFQGLYHLPPEDLRPVRSILDLGANIGLTMAHLAVLFPEARVLGVEPDLANAELAERNTRAFGPRCRVLRAAVWHESGELAYGGERESGYAVITCAGPAARSTAPAITLDALIDRMEVDLIDYVKMDVEGAEREIFRNPGSWPARVRCLKVEVHAEKASTLYPLGECLADLERLGFACSLDRRHHASIIARR